MESERKTYQEIQDAIWSGTDPARGIEQQLNVTLQGDTVMGSILQLRLIISNLEAVTDPKQVDAEVHSVMIGEEIGGDHGTLEKMKKNLARLVSDYARFLDKLQDCTCNICRASKAGLN